MFKDPAGQVVPSVTTEQMRELDRIVVEDFGLGVLQMMEHAGRNLATAAMDMIAGDEQTVVVVAGAGGNGGGGLCAARHLHNHGASVTVVLDRAVSEFTGPAARQLRTLRFAGVELVAMADAQAAISSASLTIDALIGYGLRGPVQGVVAELIEICNAHAPKILSLDVPSGLDASVGTAHGRVVRPNRILTLALPKDGLGDPDVDLSELYLADIGIPVDAVRRLGIAFESPFRREWILRLTCTGEYSRPCREQR